MMIHQLPVMLALCFWAVPATYLLPVDATGATATAHPDTILVFPQADGLQAWSDDQGLSSPAQVVATDSLLVVLDRAGSTVWVFDQSSERPSQFGRRGEGPGEFRALGRTIISRDTIWVYGLGNSRISTWHRNELVGEQRMNRPSARGEFLVVNGLGVITPEPDTSPGLLHLPEGTNRSPACESMGELPYPLDLLAYDGSRIAVLENNAARLVTIDPFTRGSSVGEARLPQAIVDESNDRIDALQGGGGHTPYQYAHDLQPMGVDRWIVTLIRPTEQCIVGVVLSPGQSPIHIAVPCDGSIQDYFPFTSITPDGDCFIAGHALGVSRWCP